MFLSRPTARPLLPPSLPPGLIGSLGSQAAHTSNKFQLQKLIRGPMALALTAPSVSSKSHGLGVGERLLKVTLNTNTKHTWALTQTPLSPLFRECTHGPASSFWNLLYHPQVSGPVFYSAPWESVLIHLTEAVCISKNTGHGSNPTPLFLAVRPRVYP